MTEYAACGKDVRLELFLIIYFAYAYMKNTWKNRPQKSIVDTIQKNFKDFCQKYLTRYFIHAIKNKRIKKYDCDK